MKKEKGILVGGGPINYPFLRRELAKGYTLLVALDGGGQPLYDLGYLPDVVLGDFDSLEPQYQEYFTGQGVRLLTYRRDKDWTDLEIGMELAAEQAMTELLIFGGLGGRLDHTLANLSLLYKAKLNKTKMLLVGQEQLVTMLAPGERVTINPFTGGHFSLLPYSSALSGVMVTGAQYPLHAATIELGSTRGVHNEFLTTPVEVGIQTGYMLLVVEGLANWTGETEIFQ